MAKFLPRVSGKKVQSREKTFLICFENHSQNVPLPTPKMHYSAIFQPAIPKTCQECFTLLSTIRMSIPLGRFYESQLCGSDTGCTLNDEKSSTHHGEDKHQRELSDAFNAAPHPHPLFRCLGASIYDICTENTPILRTKSTYNSDKGVRGVKKSQKISDIIYGSPL